MKRTFLLAVIVAPSIAAAQTPAPAPRYPAVTIDQQTHERLRGYLDQQPYMFSAPIVDMLRELSARPTAPPPEAAPKPPASGEKAQEP